MGFSHYNVEVKRSRRHSMSVEIKDGETVLVRAPYGMSDFRIREFLKKSEKWIDAHLEKVATSQCPEEEQLTLEELKDITEAAKRDIVLRVRRFAPIVGVTYNRITIKCQKTRWGSCSGKKNLNFNCLLMLAPESVRDYVVVHELCHLIEMNHSKAFWAQVERVLPDWKEQRKWLKSHGGELMKRHTGM